VNLVVTVSASGAVTGAKLAATGADVTVPAIAGLSVLALGGGLMVAARRRSAA
jgi:LPXTG-motif cell wall-anchored protein